jgi:dihydroanticapsin dehydrogenase
MRKGLTVDLKLRGRAALVTGAAGGIGSAVAHRLAEEGARVALLDRAGSAVHRVAEHVRATGADARAVSADVTDQAAVRTAVDDVTRALGGLDIVIGCAGISGPVGTALVDTRLADWRRVLEVNVTGTFLILQATIPSLRASDAASATFVASDSALVAADGMVPYCASKAAVLQLIRAAAVELSDDGIRVNAVCPSVVDTPMSRGDLGLTRGFDDVGYPVQTADDVAAQLVWLASPLSKAVNATGVVMDFGYSARSNFPA